MIKVGEINPELFINLSPISTKDVVITDKQIEHIMKRHPQDYERYSMHIPQILIEPDYIIMANKPNSAVLLKEFIVNNERFQLVLRLKTTDDPATYQNSIITFLKIRAKEWNRLINNKIILYKTKQ